MFTWDHALDTGHLEIDAQHRELFAKASAVLDAISGGRGRAEVGWTLRYLTEYVSRHFRAEEGFMRAFGYPRVQQHVVLHQALEAELAELAASYERQATRPGELVDGLERLIRAWLVKHIGEQDRAVADFLAGARSR